MIGNARRDHPPSTGVQSIRAGGRVGYHVTGTARRATLMKEPILMIPSANHFVQHDAEALVNRTVRDWLDQRR